MHFQTGTNNGLATVLVAAMALFGTRDVAAQDLSVGTWTGSMLPPEGLEAPTTYEVARTDEGRSIVMTVEGMPPVPLEEVRLTGDRLSFTFMLRTRVECVLERGDEGTFHGACTDGTGEAGRLTMQPPG